MSESPDADSASPQVYKSGWQSGQDLGEEARH